VQWELEARQWPGVALRGGAVRKTRCGLNWFAQCRRRKARSVVQPVILFMSGTSRHVKDSEHVSEPFRSLVLSTDIAPAGEVGGWRKYWKESIPPDTVIIFFFYEFPLLLVRCLQCLSLVGQILKLKVLLNEFALHHNLIKNEWPIEVFLNDWALALGAVFREKPYPVFVKFFLAFWCRVVCIYVLTYIHYYIFGFLKFPPF
jgi:hypothetical protein